MVRFSFRIKNQLIGRGQGGEDVSCLIVIVEINHTITTRGVQGCSGWGSIVGWLVILWWFKGEGVHPGISQRFKRKKIPKTKTQELVTHALFLWSEREEC